VSVMAVAHHHLLLPRTPFELWVAGELATYLGVSCRDAKVEIIGGEIVISEGSPASQNLEHRPAPLLSQMGALGLSSGPFGPRAFVVIGATSRGDEPPTLGCRDWLESRG
jgi:hypothetical protein